MVLGPASDKVDNYQQWLIASCGVNMAAHIGAEHLDKDTGLTPPQLLTIQAVSEIASVLRAATLMDANDIDVAPIFRTGAFEHVGNLVVGQTNEEKDDTADRCSM